MFSQTVEYALRIVVYLADHAPLATESDCARCTNEWKVRWR